MNADTLHHPTASAPPVDPPEPVTEPPVEPGEPGPMPPDPFPNDLDTPHAPDPEPEPDPGGLSPPTTPFPMP